jgi:hypothetical protein
MDSQEIWEFETDRSVKDPEELKDFDIIKDCISRVCDPGRLIKEIILRTYDTDNIVFILNNIAAEFDVELKALNYIEDGYVHDVHVEDNNDECN